MKQLKPKAAKTITRTRRTTRFGVHAGEVCMLITVLRGNQSLTPEFRDAAAATLEKLFWGNKGKSAYTEATNRLKPWILQLLVDARVAEMNKKGERPRGGRREKALEQVANEYAGGIDPRSLRKLMGRHKLSRRP